MRKGSMMITVGAIIFAIGTALTWLSFEKKWKFIHESEIITMSTLGMLIPIGILIIVGGLFSDYK